MKVVGSRFRCDLCGKFHNAGVTETRPSQPEHGGQEGAPTTQTWVCAPCVTQAQHLLAAVGCEADG